MGSEDRCFSVGPMFACGLGNSLSFPMAVSASAVARADPPADAGAAAEIVRTEQPTLFFAIPTFYAALNASDIPDDTFASVRLAVRRRGVAGRDVASLPRPLRRRDPRRHRLDRDDAHLHLEPRHGRPSGNVGNGRRRLRGAGGRRRRHRASA